MTPDDSFEDRLISALEPIHHTYTAFALYTLLSSGLADELAVAPRGLEELAKSHDLEPSRVLALLEFLENEGYVARIEAKFGLTDLSRDLLVFEPWYTLLIGGYGTTLVQLPEVLRRGATYASRNSAEVGRGSCGISEYDAIPLVQSLLAAQGLRPKRLLDIGCGDGNFLLSLVNATGAAEGLGIDPDPDSIGRAREHAAQHASKGRVHFKQQGALEYFSSLRPNESGEGDCYVTSFVLQEVLEQSGEDAVRGLLRAMCKVASGSHLIVIEVQPSARPGELRSGLQRAYYNPYFLLHRLTEQRLERQAFWNRLFDESGLERLASNTTDPSVDSTGYEFGTLLAVR